MIVTEAKTAALGSKDREGSHWLSPGQAPRYLSERWECVCCRPRRQGGHRTGAGEMEGGNRTPFLCVPGLVVGLLARCVFMTAGAVLCE